MDALRHKQELIDGSIEQEIRNHQAWLGKVSGLKAEKLLRGRKTPYLYVLRVGECEQDYYVTYVADDFSIRHQPFVLWTTADGWFFEQGGGGGPFTEATIDDVIHLMMHCGKDACVPFINFDVESL